MLATEADAQKERESIVKYFILLAGEDSENGPF
ncbi:MAG: hypothetical protein ACI8TP_005387, partial [Acidimicrobiales bacterium]